MRPISSRFLVVLTASAAVIGGCGQVEPGPGNFAGTYVATVFLITPPGQAVKDVLLQGGLLTVSITATNTTSGQLSLPASVTGTTPLLQLMTGQAVVTDGTLKFQQTADTFVRDLTWTVKRDTLEVVNQVVGGASYTIKMPKR